MMKANMLITPDWPAPSGIKAFASVRSGGCSVESYKSLNLGLNCGDETERVLANRRALLARLKTPLEPGWLEQVHGHRIVTDSDGQTCQKADGRISHRPDHLCLVLSADCLPVLFCDRQSSQVAAVHAGWRGLAAGILPKAVKMMQSSPQDLMVWLGPAISQEAYEIDQLVYEAFADLHHCTNLFEPSRSGHWRLDLSGIAEEQLRQAGVGAIYQSHLCTFNRPDQFFSYRRDPQCGRQACGIWIEK